MKLKGPGKMLRRVKKLMFGLCKFFKCKTANVDKISLDWDL